MPKGPSTQRMRVGAPREESPALHVTVGDGTSPKLSNSANLGAAVNVCFARAVLASALLSAARSWASVLRVTRPTRPVCVS